MLMVMALTGYLHEKLVVSIALCLLDDFCMSKIFTTSRIM